MLCVLLHRKIINHSFVDETVLRAFSILPKHVVWLNSKNMRDRFNGWIFIMFKKIFRFSLITLGSLVLLSSVSFAATPKQVGKYGDWTSYTLTERGNKVCYMVSKPVNSEGKYTNRGEIFALITHRPSERTEDVFSYITGYTYKSGSDASLKIDGKKYILFTQDDTAWAPDAAADSKLAKAIQSGSKMVVKGTSTRGTVTTDTYSLKGSGSAYRSISKECRVK